MSGDSSSQLTRNVAASAQNNPYSPTGVRVTISRFDLWNVTRAGQFVAAFPRSHFDTADDVRNALTLMARAFDHGVDSERNKPPIEAIR